MTIQALSAHAGFGPFDTRVNTMNTCPILNTPDLTFSIIPDTYRYVTVPDAHSIHARYWSKQSILAVPDTRRYVSIPGFSVRTRIGVDFPDVDFLDFHVSASCLRLRPGGSGRYYKYTPIRCDTLRYKAILQNTHRYEATHDNFKNDTDARRRHMTTSEYTPIRGIHDNTSKYDVILQNTHRCTTIRCDTSEYTTDT